MADYDIIGNIAIIKGEGKSKKKKLEQARGLLKQPSIKTVVEKISNVKGRLRTINVKHLSGEKSLIAEYRENGSVFKFDVEKCYFSPRLSNDRKEIALKIKKKDKVLVMFAGVGVYPIVIYKIAKPLKVVGVEISRECCRWFKENLELNKINKGQIEIIQGDVKKKINKSFIKKYGRFDVIMMARPNLKESFLDIGLRAAKKGTSIFYHAFGRDIKLKEEIKKLKKKALDLNCKVKILRILKAGEIAPYKFRWRVEMKVIK